MIFWKRNKKFYFFDFFSKGGTLWCQNGQNGFFFFQFFKFHNFFPQNSYIRDQKDTKINKVLNFGASSHKTVEVPNYFRLFWSKRAPLSTNKVNDRKTLFLYSWNRDYRDRKWYSWLLAVAKFGWVLLERKVFFS